VDDTADEPPHSAGVLVRRFAPADASLAVDLLQAAFGTWPRGVEGQNPTDFFRWKHELNPFGRSLKLVAEADGRVVGFAAWLPWRMRLGRQTITALRVVDVAVAAAARNRGVYRQLLDEAPAHFPQGAALTLSTPNAQSRRGSLSAGSVELQGLPLLVRVRAPLLVTQRMFARRSSRRARIVEAEPAAAALRDGGVEALLAQARSDWPSSLITAKDLGYLCWRYGSLPAYRAIRIHAGGQLRGIAIFRVYARERIDVATVCELLIARGGLAVARSLLGAVGRAASFGLVTCRFAPGSTPHRAALLTGFVRAHSRSLPTVRALRPEILPDLSQRAAWSLCQGDFDLL
jgi:GNAT superfamily N-acetyltransferase